MFISNLTLWICFMFWSLQNRFFFCVLIVVFCSFFDRCSFATFLRTCVRVYYCTVGNVRKSSFSSFLHFFLHILLFQLHSIAHIASFLLSITIIPITDTKQQQQQQHNYTFIGILVLNISYSTVELCNY